MAYLDDTGLAYFWGKIKAWCSSLFALDGDVVHKAGTETVSGQKIFSENVQLSVDAVKGTLPSSQKWRSVVFVDSIAGDATHASCAVNSQVDEQGDVRAYLRAYKWEAGSTDSAILSVVQPLSGDPYAVAPSTLESRSYGQDIVTRDWLSKDARLVHVGGRERIIGQKYFNQYFNVEVPLVRGTVPSEAVYSGFSFYDTSEFAANDGDSARKFGALANIVGSDGSSHTYMRAYKNAVGGGDSAVLEVVYPASGDPYAVAPSTSTSRSAGTDIVTRDFIPNDTRIVHTTGNETINGLKTFSGSDINIKNPAIEILNTPSENKSSAYAIVDKDDNRLAYLQYIYRTNGAYDVKMACFHQTNLLGFTAIQVGYDENDIGYATATSTSSLRSNGTDIVTRDWIPNDTRIVHTTGNETISGSKTFTNYVLSTGFRVNDGSNNAHELVFQDSSSSDNSGIWDSTFTKWVVVSDGNGDVSLYGNAFTATKLATARNLKVALGSTTAVTFDGSASQNSIPVSGVLDVANGGTGSSTKNFVDLSNAQTVEGVKTFSSNVLCNAFRSAGTAAGSVTLEGGSSGNGAFFVAYGRSHSSYAGQFSCRTRASNGDLDRVLTGHPGGTLTWNGQTIQTTSDERLKTPLSVVPDAVLDAWEAAGWGEFRFLDAVEEKGDSARLHLGLIAQRVRAVFEERGLDACRYGILCYEAEEDLWMVRYTEALAMEAACQRRRADRAEARIAALEDRLAALELRLGSE